jgi:hypothetical protein
MQKNDSEQAALLTEFSVATDTMHFGMLFLALMQRAGQTSHVVDINMTFRGTAVPVEHLQPLMQKCQRAGFSQRFVSIIAATLITEPSWTTAATALELFKTCECG